MAENVYMAIDEELNELGDSREFDISLPEHSEVFWEILDEYCEEYLELKRWD